MFKGSTSKGEEGEKRRERRGKRKGSGSEGRVAPLIGESGAAEPAVEEERKGERQREEL